LPCGSRLGARHTNERDRSRHPSRPGLPDPAPAFDLAAAYHARFGMPGFVRGSRGSRRSATTCGRRRHTCAGRGRFARVAEATAASTQTPARRPRRTSAGGCPRRPLLVDKRESWRVHTPIVLRSGAPWRAAR
jgi:hypothetical protein